jgi:hypothetical protein
MSQHEINFRIESYIAFVFGLVIFGALLAHSQHKDATDDATARAQVKQQAKAAAQPDTWARLERQGCAMVACDRIGK